MLHLLVHSSNALEMACFHLLFFPCSLHAIFLPQPCFCVSLPGSALWKVGTFSWVTIKGEFWWSSQGTDARSPTDLNYSKKGDPDIQVLSPPTDFLLTFGYQIFQTCRMLVKRIQWIPLNSLMNIFAEFAYYFSRYKSIHQCVILIRALENKVQASEHSTIKLYSICIISYSSFTHDLYFKVLFTYREIHRSRAY